jgi:hypothetical protein
MVLSGEKQYETDGCGADILKGSAVLTGQRIPIYREYPRISPYHDRYGTPLPFSRLHQARQLMGFELSGRRVLDPEAWRSAS